LLKRADHENFWQSVTGSMEWTETRPADTARRELYEELGLTATENLRDLEQVNEYKILPQWLYRYQPGVALNIEHAFSLEMPDESGVTLNPQEHEAAAWLDINEAIKRVSSWSNRTVIETLGRNLGL
jgi:dATP pyrophosphohydrolase